MTYECRGHVTYTYWDSLREGFYGSTMYVTSDLLPKEISEILSKNAGVSDEVNWVFHINKEFFKKEIVEEELYYCETEVNYCDDNCNVFETNTKTIKISKIEKEMCMKDIPHITI